MQRLLSSDRHVTNLLSDSGIQVLAVTLAYLIRFEGTPGPKYLRQFFVLLLLVVVFRITSNEVLGGYRLLWRYVCLSDAVRLLATCSIASIALVLVRVFHAYLPLPLYITRIPFSIIVLEFLLTLTGSLGARCLQRLAGEHRERTSRMTSKPVKRIALYGAGSAGAFLLRDLQANPEVEVVGFMDDDRKKVGAVIGGKRVLGTGDHLREIVTAERIDEVVVSIASAGPGILAQIVAKCKDCFVPAKVVPSICEILSGHVSVSNIRSVTIEDLLARESLTRSELSESLSLYTNKRILITGGGGSIGSELVRQVLRHNPERVAILDKDENCVYDLEQELHRKHGDPPLELFIADVRNADRLRKIVGGFKPHLVFHAAAHKHVPLMERNVCEAILNNVHGTQNVLQIALEVEAERFIFISSDKAVNPSNIMGATKRIGEVLVGINANRGSMRSAAVRFGNVLGSRGSVIPLFQKQIAEGGPVTVTHEHMTRFFMTIPEAVHLVLRAGTLADRSDIFMLDMGKPRRILDVAHEMIRLSGFEPGRDIKVVITGLRPGEKLHEELVRPEEAVYPTGYSKLSRISMAQVDPTVFLDHVSQLIRSAERNNRPEVFELLRRMDLGFQPAAQAAGVASSGEMAQVAVAAG